MLVNAAASGSLAARPVEAAALLRTVEALTQAGCRFVTATCVDTGTAFEVLYHFDRDGKLEHLRVTLPKGEALPSIGGIHPGATLLENEFQDLFGLAVTGLAVDYRGRMLLAEDAPTAPFARPAGAAEAPEGAGPASESSVGPAPGSPVPDSSDRPPMNHPAPLEKPVPTEKRTVVPFGPQHPVLPEPFQLRLVLEDERVVDVAPSIGYVHRGLEKLAEKKEFPQNIFIVERVCGICSFMHALSYCLGIEELMGIKAPSRADYLRVVWAELHRMHSHLLWAGLFADSLGFESLFMEAWRCRETVMELLEATAGNRIIISTCTIGGVRRDIDDALADRVLAGLEDLERGLQRLVPSFLDDLTVRKRTVGKGVVTPEEAWRCGAIGPVARASGLAVDQRSSGYAAYDRLAFTPVVETAGDAYARGKVRLRELFQSIDLIRQALAAMPEGELAVPAKGCPSGEAVVRVEQPRGEVLYYLKANGTKQLERLRVRTPTFATLPLLFHMIPGSELADVPVLVLSIDPCISCTER